MKKPGFYFTGKTKKIKLLFGRFSSAEKLHEVVLIIMKGFTTSKIRTTENLDD